ncbi:MAG: 3D domain-containing protein [Armatimonas sp.]
MVRQLSGLLAALCLITGLTEVAMAARVRVADKAKPTAQAKSRLKAKAKKKSTKPPTAKRVARKKAAKVRVTVAEAPRKPRKKPAKVRVAKAKVLKKRTVRVGRVPRHYIRSFSALVTAYVPIETPMEGGRWTCTMRDGWRTHGIAVDPKYIPLGSLLYVPGYGKALADDTGGRIKGRHIDVRHHSVESMHHWGVKRIRVYVLKHPPKKKRATRVLSA